MTMKGPEGDAVIDRYISNGRSRMDLEAQGERMSMIDVGDEAQTYYSLMPSEKMAIKDSWKSLHVAHGADSTVHGLAPTAPPPSARVTALGRETIDGRDALKYRVETEGGMATAWIDAQQGAPLRMESEKGTITFTLPETGPQKAELFEVPKDYQTMDMAAMRSQMSAMMPGGLPGGIPGMGGGMGGFGAMAKGAMGSMAHQTATQAGGDLGASVGAGIGGPIGAMVGRYIGQRAAGWLADKVTGGGGSGGSGMPGFSGAAGMSGSPMIMGGAPSGKKGHH
jgi:hypothetical protein